MTQVIAISKKTKDVLGATDPNDFIFHSDYNTFKILAEGRLLSQTVDGHPKTFSVNHGLGYVPNFYAFCKFPDGKTALAGPLSPDFTIQPYVNDNGYGSFTVEADSSNLYFIFTSTSWLYGGGFGGNYNVNIKWYIFEVAL